MRRVPDTSKRTLPILTGCKGVLKPGTTTLLLAPPGHGKTSFLRALCGRVPAANVSGSISYSGADQKELKAKGVFLQLLANYVDQLDTHLPFLTVRETAAFACANSTVEPAIMAHPLLEAAAGERVERVLELLKLQNCANTLVGNELVRGISGGEKKRVTIAEALVSNARLLCLDEISTGLDASVTYDICASIRAWAQEMRGTVIVALLQPTPEVYNQFDDVLLMREGAVVYHGPREALPGYLSGLGFTPPRDVDAESADMADWLVDLLASPTVVLRKAAAAKSAASSPDLAVLEDFGTSPRTTAALVEAWTGSALCAERSSAPATAKPLELTSAFAKQQYGRPYPRSAMRHFEALMGRQVKITLRNKPFVIARIMSSCVMSLIFGSMWFKLSMSEGLQKYGMLLFALLQIAFANLAELPFAVEYKLVACKQIRAGLYPASGYTWACTMTILPIAVVETAVFSAILYNMVGLANDGGRWAFFYLILLMVNVGFGSMYRGIAYIFPSYEAAQTAPGPFIAMQVIFAGFLIPPKHMARARSAARSVRRRAPLSRAILTGHGGKRHALAALHVLRQPVCVRAALAVSQRVLRARVHNLSDQELHQQRLPGRQLVSRLLLHQGERRHLDRDLPAGRDEHRQCRAARRHPRLHLRLREQRHSGERQRAAARQRERVHVPQRPHKVHHHAGHLVPLPLGRRLRRLPPRPAVRHQRVAGRQPHAPAER